MAWTTAAAKMIDGQTLHKFLQVGIAELPEERVLEKVKANLFVRAKVTKTTVIFIDELPLIAARWFSVLEYVVRQLAPAGRHGRPWGGCQVVVGGDPLQLGPVHTRTTRHDAPVFMCRICRDSFLSRYGMLAFLMGSHRQSSDSWFVASLDRVRKGEVTDVDLMVLNATSDSVTADEWDRRTQLRALNVHVNAFNKDKLSRLAGAEYVFKCRDEIAPGLTHPARRAYAQRCMQQVAPPSVALKPGAVVLTTREVDGVPTATQGEVKECRGLSVVCEFSGRLVKVAVAAFDVIDNCGTRLATRHAMPLILAWAMTIHRAQGATLNTLAIDFGQLNWRLEGLVYSGLFRCRTLEGLFVRVLRGEHIVVDRDATAFYDR
ncbi:hypothetical protein BU14_0033s0075 [Porphyra umbilicalis]|uniref:ATP-dependent DNA helicase n=1 Tax=Porphyra umbilicalis TaxID=2786 RepID=A0A1X6PIN8_PORUM|nr:hypothetical protein BU14_0033s0075 [Porphyra umbilicalis]|eukprot:OSX80731.1 hypothetical protein BU14_0033s0075 [Porphyra umbilicalis]